MLCRSELTMWCGQCFSFGEKKEILVVFLEFLSCQIFEKDLIKRITRSYPKFKQVAKNIEGCQNVFYFHNFKFANHLRDDCHLSNITKLKRKKTLGVGPFIMNQFFRQKNSTLNQLLERSFQAVIFLALRTKARILCLDSLQSIVA